MDADSVDKSTGNVMDEDKDSHFVPETQEIIIPDSQVNNGNA